MKLVLMVWIAAMAGAAEAATISGAVTDASGAAVPGARVTIRGLATGQETSVETGPDGRYRYDTSTPGQYLFVFRRTGFSEAARTVTIAAVGDNVDVPVQLLIGSVTTEVSVTAARAERDNGNLPLHVESVTQAGLDAGNPLSVGDALALAANVTPVGNGPFGVRPRLRGLDSTRLLILVDGERLNTARQATDRTGAETGLVSPDAVERIEVVNGAGTTLYGSDALAGTINIVTSEPHFADSLRITSGLNSYYSSNEKAVRGTGTFGVSARRFAVRVQAGGESFGDYSAGKFGAEDTNPLFTSGQLVRTDTIDTNFGFNFKAFPDPFNAPYVRTDRVIQNSGARGKFLKASGLFLLGERRTLSVRYQGRRMDAVGFPDFLQPYFFNATSLPSSDLDRISTRYEAKAVTPWLANLSVTAHYQRTDRTLRNLLPVQFPAPTANTFFPISVFRLNVLSDTEQRVWTPGVDVQAVLAPTRKHVLTTGLTFYRDRSSDRRTTATTTYMVGQVVQGARGPAANVFPSWTQLGPAAIAHPVRVPDAHFQDVAVFAQDEWRVHHRVSIIGGMRGDFYDVVSKATPGYDVDSVVAGARPSIDPSTLPSVNGGKYSRKALTGDIGLVVNSNGRWSPFVRYGRSYRHPNLEEMFFAGPATAGSIAPNVKVKPEHGDNFDTGLKYDLRRVSGGVFAFVNRYKDFIVQDLAQATTPSGPLAQTTNYADVRIQGIEVSADAPVVLSRGVLMFRTSSAFTRGTIVRGTNPLDKTPLDGKPADNITPFKTTESARFTDSRGRVWAEYGVRIQTDVKRVTPTLLASPFRVAQDLLSLSGYTVHRIGWGLRFNHDKVPVGLTFAVENLTNVYYREQFQFAPSRGRTLTVRMSLGSFD